MRWHDRDAVPDAGQRDERVGRCALERNIGTKMSMTTRRIEPLPGQEVRAEQE